MTDIKSYVVGEIVEVYSFGRWYGGRVTKVGRTRVKVLYTTGTGATRDKAFDLARVRSVPLFHAAAQGGAK